MSKWIYIAQFHTEHLSSARCTSISRTGSSSMCAERHLCLQSVHAVRQAVNPRRSEPWHWRDVRCKRIGKHPSINLLVVLSSSEGSVVSRVYRRRLCTHSYSHQRSSHSWWVRSSLYQRISTCGSLDERLPEVIWMLTPRCSCLPHLLMLLYMMSLSSVTVLPVPGSMNVGQSDQHGSSCWLSSTSTTSSTTSTMFTLAHTTLAIFTVTPVLLLPVLMVVSVVWFA